MGKKYTVGTCKKKLTWIHNDKPLLLDLSSVPSGICFNHNPQNRHTEGGQNKEQEHQTNSLSLTPSPIMALKATTKLNQHLSMAFVH